MDDATGKQMELRFVKSESAFDYFASTEAYLRRYGKPVAFYSDKHSIFRVNREGTTGRDRGMTQFGRALAELNIDIICANSPQAKGRVERMNRSLQDRLVKELRLAGISTMDAGNAFLPDFMLDYNRRFGRPARNPHDAHRPLRDDEDLARIFTWREERRMSRNLVVHFKRVTYLIEPTKETRPLAGKLVQVHESDDGKVEMSCEGIWLPYSVFDKHPHVPPGAIVENKRLGELLSLIQAGQERRDEVRLASKKLTLRQKDRIRRQRIDSQLPTEPAPTIAAPPRQWPVPPPPPEADQPREIPRYRIRWVRKHAYLYERPEGGGKEEYRGRVNDDDARVWETGDQKRPPNMAAAWTEPRSSKRAVPRAQPERGRPSRSIRHHVRWTQGHAYLYERTYLGVLRSGRPRYSDRYLGRVNDDDARRWRSHPGSPLPQLVRAWTEPRADRPRKSSRALGVTDPPAPAAPRASKLPPKGDRLGAMLSFLKKVETEQKARRKKSNDVTNQRKRDREFESLRSPRSG